MEKKHGPRVSVIIPTTNEEFWQAKFSEECLKHSTYNNIEVIIINEGLERSEQRNIGLTCAEGKYVMYLDSDQFVSEDLVRECVSLMEQGANGIYIPEVIITKGWFARLRNFERQFYTGTPVDCVRFFKRKGCPVFDTTLKGPEDSLHDRQIPQPKKVSTNVVYHNDGVGIKDYFRKKAYYAKSMKRFEELCPKDKCLDWKYRCFGVFFEKGKWKRALCNPISMIGIYIIILIRGIIYLKNK